MISVRDTVKRVLDAATAPLLIFPAEVYITDISGARDDKKVFVESTASTTSDMSFPISEKRERAQQMEDANPSVVFIDGLKFEEKEFKTEVIVIMDKRMRNRDTAEERESCRADRIKERKNSPSRAVTVSAESPFSTSKYF